MIPKGILEEFQTHCTSLRHAYNARREAVVLKNVVEDRQDREATAVEDTLGKRQPTDKYEGDVNLRTLRLLLKMIDDRGWERYAIAQIGPFRATLTHKPQYVATHSSDHQLAFHSAFERCVSRVLYKNEWATQRPAIMKHNDWDKCSSEVMISYVCADDATLVNQH